MTMTCPRSLDLRAATAVNESRMMKGHLLRENMRRALHFCEDATCTHEHCGECIEEDDEVAPPPAAGDLAVSVRSSYSALHCFVSKEGETAKTGEGLGGAMSALWRGACGDCCRSPDRTLHVRRM